MVTNLGKSCFPSTQATSKILLTSKVVNKNQKKVTLYEGSQFIIHLGFLVSISRDVVAAYSKDSAFNAYVYLAYRNNKAGTLGIAYTGTTCEKNVFYRTSLNEYQGGDLNTGLVRGLSLNDVTHIINCYSSIHYLLGLGV